MRQIAIAIVQWNDQVLVGQRPEGVELAGYWEFPGGKLEAGEEPAAAVEREVREETGLATQAGQTMAVVQHTYDYGQLVLHFIRCQLLGDPHQVRPPFRWCERKKLADLQFPAANQAIVAQLVDEP